MTLLNVVGHHWRRRWRSSTRGRSLLTTLLFFASIGYFGLLLTGLGWFYPEMVSEAAPHRDPLRLLNRHALTGLAALLGARFLLQRSISTDLRVYLTLPICRSQLARVFQVTSALSLFNVLPLLVVGALWLSTVFPTASTLGEVYWMIGGVSGVAATQFVNSLLRVGWKRSPESVVGVALIIGVVGFGISWLGGGFSFVSLWLFDGLVSGEMLPLLVAVGGSGSLAATAHRLFRKQMYEALETPAQFIDTSRVALARKGRQYRGPVASFAMLDTKLIYRNKQPRRTLLAQLPILGFVAWQLFSSTPDQTGWVDLLSTQFYCFAISGQFGAAYHGFAYAWHGKHFEGIVARPQPLRVLIRGQYITFAGLCAGPGVFLLFFAGLTCPSLVGPLSSMLLYHLGLTAPLLLAGCVWVRKAVYLNQNTVYGHGSNTTAYSMTTGLGIVILIGIPAGLTLWIGFISAMWCVAILGSIGIMISMYWTRGVALLLRHNRYAMADGFRGTK